jgi:phage FluMu protein Com
MSNKSIFIFFGSAIIFFAFFFYFADLYNSRCPKCKKFRAAEQINSRFKDETMDPDGPGGEKSFTHRMYYENLRCKFCNFKWEDSTESTIEHVY